MIVKSRIYNLETDRPVTISNQVYIPTEGDVDEAALADARKRDEQQRREQEEKRIQALVDERVRKTLEQSKAQIDAYANEITQRATAEAESIKADAKQTTISVLEKATKEADAIREQAREQGYKEGFDQGSNDAKTKCEKYVEASAKFLAEINAKKEAYYMSHEALLKDTIYDMVRKITLSELDNDDKMVERIIANASKSFRNSDYIKISLLEGDVSKEFVSDAEFINKLIPFVPEIEIEYLNPEETEKGTVILDNDKEIIDASVPTQLEFLREIIKNQRGE